MYNNDKVESDCTSKLWFGNTCTSSHDELRLAADSWCHTPNDDPGIDHSLPSIDSRTSLCTLVWGGNIHSMIHPHTHPHPPTHTHTHTCIYSMPLCKGKAKINVWQTSLTIAKCKMHLTAIAKCPPNAWNVSACNVLQLWHCCMYTVCTCVYFCKLHYICSALLWLVHAIVLTVPQSLDMLHVRTCTCTFLLYCLALFIVSPLFNHVPT